MMTGRPTVLSAFSWKRVSLLLGAAGTVVLSACTPQQDEAQRRLTQHQFLQVASAKTQIGEDCSSGGPNSCVEGLCLHFEADPHKGWNCSRVCTYQDDCPTDWRCQPLAPGASVAACFPEKGLTGARAVERTGKGVPPDPWKMNRPNETVMPKTSGALPLDSGIQLSSP